MRGLQLWHMESGSLDWDRARAPLLGDEAQVSWCLALASGLAAFAAPLPGPRGPLSLAPRALPPFLARCGQ